MGTLAAGEPTTGGSHIMGTTGVLGTFGRNQAWPLHS